MKGTDDTSLLHDGRELVNSIAVFLFCRNNASYIEKYLIHKLRIVESTYPQTHFTYYIFENDSTDNTAAILSDFLHENPRRRGCFMTKKMSLNDDQGGTTFSRIERIAFVRNCLLDEVREQVTAVHQWCLFIDTNIFFDELVLRQMFSYAPAANDIAMLTCNTIEVMHKDSVDGTEIDNTDVPYVTSYHYYDTFAFVDAQNRLLYPSCIHPQCHRLECFGASAKHTWKDVMDVRSAWAGFVLIHASALKHPAVRWKPLQIMNENSICEHVYFCDMLQAINQKRIVVLGDVHCYWLK